MFGFIGNFIGNGILMFFGIVLYLLLQDIFKLNPFYPTFLIMFLFFYVGIRFILGTADYTGLNAKYKYLITVFGKATRSHLNTTFILMAIMYGIVSSFIIYAILTKIPMFPNDNFGAELEFMQSKLNTDDSIAFAFVVSSLFIAVMLCSVYYKAYIVRRFVSSAKIKNGVIGTSKVTKMLYWELNSVKDAEQRVTCLQELGSFLTLNNQDDALIDMISCCLEETNKANRNADLEAMRYVVTVFAGNKGKRPNEIIDNSWSEDIKKLFSSNLVNNC